MNEGADGIASVQRSYAPDYVGVALILAAYLGIQFLVEPYHRMFFLDNIAIQFPHALKERVPVSWLFGYAGGIPLVVLLVWIPLSRPDGHKIHVTFLGFFIGLLLTSFLTDVIKNAVGRPRPDLISRCRPEKGTPAHQLVTFSVCTETNHHVIHDGWRSFPSGHSSFAFSGLGYLSLFLSGQMRVFRPKTDLVRVLIAFAPLLGAGLIAISRCEDYRHDVYDVSVGSLLGIFVAYFAYRRCYPPLRSQSCNVPYPSRQTAVERGGVDRDGRGAEDDAAARAGMGSGDPDGDDEAIPLYPLSESGDIDLERGIRGR
ncbi:MAG: hypothetical protein M1826_002112 [Phylliscum demangeonii]|nr:MAG: hypothetical protein M1826_002112 [Phylliscum demangeonii]